MNNFNIQSYIDPIYAAYPEAERQPIIGITGNYADGDLTLREKYYQQVIAAGATPIVIPPVADKNTIINILDHIDGLILSGGADFNPLWSGEEPCQGLGHINAQRDLPELLITRLAYNRQIPMLGICRGMQTLAMALGGRVTQDINTCTAQPSPLTSHPSPLTSHLSPLTSRFSSSKKNSQSATPPIRHDQDARQSELTHSVNIRRDSILYDIYGEEKIYVNSFHHQAVADGGKSFRITAHAADGIVEGMESTEYKAILGVQWHPEWLESGLPIFQWLVEQARQFSTAKHIHHRIITLDTHCDTPMFFHQGIRFDQRDPRILVDLHKMTEGHQSSVIMAAYLPQPKIGEQFSSLVKPPAPLTSQLSPLTSQLSPFSYANAIFDHIEDIVRKNSQYISIARTPADLYEDKRKGRKSIMLAIENALALDHQLQNVKHFAQRGVVYMTLCHNGDNDICDSAKGCNTHNGVSQFGEKVIQQMNQQGIMVDLSHAGEKSFYDALDISQTPIVCSHSSCRALCDHPRNLTDDQMRALAQAGGVMQVTLYHGFLRQEGEATILDALAHLEHAIKVMGIDHVGLGTDFDGDGGVRGLADSSEMIQFTLHLLRRKYSLRDIEKIWGANWLRVMTQVQNH